MKFILAPLSTRAENSLLPMPHFANNKGAYSAGYEPHNRERESNRYASIPAPLTDLLYVKTRPFVFFPSARGAFQVLKSLLTSTPVHHFFDLDLPS